MKDLNTIKKEIQDLWNTQYKENQSLPKVDNAGRSTFGKCWATVVSIDICGFKKIVEKVTNEKSVKLIQTFQHWLTVFAEDEKFSDIFRDLYFAGDEVIVVFETSQKDKITKAMEFAFFANSIANYVLPKEISRITGGAIQFKCGIGVWTSNDNSLVLAGRKFSQDYSASTLIGGAINKASYLAKLANRTIGYTTYSKILYNNTTSINLLGSTKESCDKWASRTNQQFGEEIWQADIYMSNYE